MRTLIQSALLACLSFCTLSAIAAEPAYDTLISHRGESVDAPENTLPAFKTAVTRGFGFECDIYLSADKRVFTFHDRDLKRTSGGKNTKKCAEANWETELSKLDVGGWGPWKGSKFVGTRPALLEEVLDLAVDGRWIYVEVKTGPEIVPYVRDIFQKQSKANPRNTLFITFNANTCSALKKALPAYKSIWLVSPKKGKYDTADALIAQLKALGADGVDCHYKPGFVTAEYVTAVRDAGFEFHVWTVDKLVDTLEAFKRGVQTVTTNCAKKQLDQYKAAKK
ncbi:MAG: glycerophosphodiester phosphodiesterase [Kiritimatiellae bacterium]|nr:glycerophosphodiester phosphodiesterase [Kiritimatiellia bacterium]